MKILITGAFGFVGSNLSKAFSKELNYRLMAVDINEASTHFYNEFYSWNDLEKIDWNKVDSIIHLAGKAHDTQNTTEEKAYFEINVGLTQKVFEYFQKSNVSKFIFFSSVKAVADTVSGTELLEDEKPHPQTPYGKSKLEAEKYLLNQSLSGNKKVYIFRPAMIHGPENKGNLNLLYQIVSKGIPWPLGAFENSRSFTSIGNLECIIREFINKDIKPGIYNIADDEPVATNRLVQLIAQSKGKKARIWKLNAGLVKKTARAGDYLKLPLNSERLKKLTESYVVSNKKLRIALGVEKLPHSAEEGLIKTLKTLK